MRFLSNIALSLLFAVTAFCQETFPVNGISDERAELFAFTNATVYKSYNSPLANATLLIQKGKVLAVGTAVTIPANAVVVDLKGAYIYPSFIDLYADYGVAPVKKAEGGKGDVSSKKGAYGWNEAIKPEIKAHELFKTDSKSAEELRKLGFGAVLTHQKDGIARGSGVLVTLGDKKENEETVKDNCSAHFSFDKGASQQDYPYSLMGAIALLRQTYLDAQWYASLKAKEPYNISLDAWNRLLNVPKVFEVNHFLSLLRADKIGDEFGTQYIFKGAGDEYKRITEVKATGASLIVPVNFPDAYDVENPFDALQLNLADMKHWELAPTNPAVLNKSEIEFSLTTAGLKEKHIFFSNVRKAIKNGLSEEAALKALTYSPAKMMNLLEQLGSLETGRIANFFIATGNIFTEGTRITENWVQGKRYAVDNTSLEKIDGVYKLTLSGLTFPGNSYSMTIEGSPFKTKATLQLRDTVKADVQLSRTDNTVSLFFNVSPEKNIQQFVRLSGVIEKEKWWGKGQWHDGTWLNWEVRYEKALDPKEQKQEEKKDSLAPVGKVVYPFAAYGYTEAPKQETVLIKNATVWTNEKGIITNADVLIKNGKIAAVGKNLSDASARVIDGTGKHVTCGIIDEHSHIAISRGVNEGAQASSAEVRIGDVVNSEDINIYRQLAGGVTAAQLLHGSANPIGGQSQIIKLRWGFAPEKMKVENAPLFIKFALGENVKRSNWGGQPYERYPQTRMGVEQVYVDYFTRALEYEKKQNAFASLSQKQKLNSAPPRRDLELETLLEILRKKRFITCHSYVQSEINMLMKVAERFNFRVNTFTHILEGYKLADKMKAHGVHASSFADWWAYKYEVTEAIPYNAAILTGVGVNTAINSDDAEMGRRLNQEAAKCVKYGALTEEEAWKLVTLNPAKMLHLDDRMGSLKTGKDADVVIWSGNPLSVYTRVEMTFVDGICFFDVKRDAALRNEIAAERNRLLQKMILAKKAGEKTQQPAGTMERIYHCETMEGHDE